MSRYVIDSSALLTIFKGETGHEMVAPLLRSALISAVNSAECVSALVRDGIAPDSALDSLRKAPVRVVPFDRSLAEQAGTLIAKTKPYGLSLGDRACLALAMREGLPVLTADRAWTSVKLDIDIHLVR
jgi:PIN domain nuclease of toxin-antitoxin system